MALTPAQRAMYGRMGAAIARARHNPADLTAEARRRFLSKFAAQARELHPEASDAEIARVAKELRSAHFLRLAAASSRARAEKAQHTPHKRTADAANAPAALGADRVQDDHPRRRAA